MKVLMVGNHPSVKGGITSVIKQLRSYDWEKENIVMKFVPTYVEKNNILKILFFCQAYIRVLFNIIFWKPEVIHMHMSYKGSFVRKYLIHKLCKVFHIREVVHLHGSEFKKWYDESSEEKRLKIRKLLREVDRFIVLGSEWEYRIKEIEPLTDIVVVNNTVAIPEQTVKWNEKEFNILFLGVLIKRKGVSDLLQAMDLLNKKSLLENVKLGIVGTGSEEENLRNQCKLLGLDKYVIFYGWMDGKKKEELLLNSQLFVLPSYNEGLPMAVLESMSYGLPIVSTYVGDMKEAVDNGENGYLVDPGDIEGLANTLEYIIALAESRWKKVSENARKKVEERFSDSNYKYMFLHIYEDCLKIEKER